MNKALQLKQWLFNKPIIFALVFFVLTLGFGVIYSLIQTLFHFESTLPVILIFCSSFVFSAWYMIKKLSQDKIYQKDLVAITNGASIISISASLIAMFIIGLIGTDIKQKIMTMYILHQTQFSIILSLIILVSLYLFGVAISGLYAKYKRATTMGIAPWKVILSMPFAFLMMWAPGYLIEDKSKKSNIVIKSKWYTKFNNWVVSNFSNLLFVFLFLLFAKSIIAGLSTTILTIALLVIYTLWYVKHKSDFVKNINDGYALTAVGINLAILIAVIISSI